MLRPWETPSEFGPVTPDFSYDPNFEPVRQHPHFQACGNTCPPSTRNPRNLLRPAGGADREPIAGRIGCQPRGA